MRRIVGLLDLGLTIALIIHIICYTIHPLLQERVVFGLKSDLNRGTPPPQEEETSKVWIWSFLVLCALFAMIPVLAAITLIVASTPNMNYERSLDMTKFWMHCNTFTIAIATAEFIVVSLIHLLGIRIGVPLPTLFYIGCRVIFTYIIWKQLDKMSPTLTTTFDPGLVDDKRERYREIRKLPIHEQRMQPEFRVGVSSPVLPLRPYRGDGFSGPSCQCVGSQTD